ncbi:MAG: DUF885 domain-containing protein [Lachnospiraceae bacterium]
MHVFTSHLKCRIALLSSLVYLTIFFTGCVPPAASTNDNTAFRTFTGQLFQQEVSSNTISLHYTLQNPKDYGVLDAPVTFGSYDFHEAGTRAALENCRAALSQFSYSELSNENRLTYDVLKSYLDTSAKGCAYQLYEEPLSPLTGIQAQLPLLLSEYQFQTTADIDTYLNLLPTITDYFDSLIRFEQKKSDAGLFMSATLDDVIISECRAFVEMDETNYLYSTFRERLKEMETLSDSQIETYLARNREMITSHVFPAYEHLSTALTALKGTGKNENGLAYLPKGKDYYCHVVARETGSARTVPELKELTKQQIQTDLMAMQSQLTAAHLAAPQMATENETALACEKPITILKDLEGKIAKTFPAPPPVTTRVKYVPAIMQPYLSPAFYLIPPIDNFSENVIYINQGRTVNGIELYTTLAHEGYPGHLYQTIYYAGHHPDPLRNILNFGGYVEGWATYAEMMSYYFAPLSKEQSLLLQKNNSATLGLYALADMGIHYEGWTFSDTLSFFKDYGITDRTSVTGIYNLILSDPANYLKYYIGYIEFLHLKKEAMEKWGEDFTQKRFHQTVLSVGPAPFDIVRKYTLDGISLLHF